VTQEQRWLQTCQSCAQATPREWSANDERMYRLGLELIAAVRAEEQQRLDRLRQLSPEAPRAAGLRKDHRRIEG